MMLPTGVTVTCFLLSYAIVLLLELSRWAFRMPYRIVALLVMTLLGVLTHTLFLIDIAAKEVHELGPQFLLSSWYDWALLSALCLGIVYLILIIRRPESPLGTFIVPMLIGLIVLASFLKSQPHFDRETSMGIWRWTHGISLMVGMMMVTFGMAMATMYLVQAWILKRKKSRSSLLRLPSLEYLQAMGQSTLYVSAVSIGVGLISGVMMNLQKNSRVVWTESGILFSAGLFLWLLVASFLQWKLSRRGLGRWTAYLNIGSFVLMLFASILVVSAPHGRTKQEPVPTLEASEVRTP